MENKNKISISSAFWSNLFKEPISKSELEDLLASNPLFEGFEKKDFERIMEIIHNRVYEAGEYIFIQGDPGLALYIIQEGTISIIRRYQNLEYKLATFSRGDFFGELSIFEKDTRTASAIAESKCKVAVLFKPDLEEFASKYPKKGMIIYRGIARIVSTRLKAMNEDFIKLYADYKNLLNEKNN
jgi:CRP-like cAMP-binding protein